MFHPKKPYYSHKHAKNELENQSVQDLENYAKHKAEETTKTLDTCLKLAEKMRNDAAKTLVVLHHQGEQITEAHSAAANIDYDLSRGEKLLGNLGGIFRWKPTKTSKISGPVMARGTQPDENRRKCEKLKLREKLRLKGVSKGKLNARTTYPEPNDVYQKFEVEEAKQDDTLAHLSNILDELKDMAHEIGVEFDRSTGALDPIVNDVDTLNSRLKVANRRGRYLLRK